MQRTWPTLVGVRKRHPKPISLTICAVVLAPMVVTSSEPLPEPGNCFGAGGFVVRAGAGSAADYTVVLLYKGGDPAPSADWHRATDSYGMTEGIAITSATGRFRVGNCTYYYLPDSLAVAVVLPDTMFMSRPVGTSTLHVTEIEAPHKVDGFMCDDTEWHVESYAYEFVDSLLILVP
jgi:hypothetical protein